MIRRKPRIVSRPLSLSNPLEFAPLEARQVLAGIMADGLPYSSGETVAGLPYFASQINDPFTDNAVSIKQMETRAQYFPYMKGELVVAIRTSTQVAQAGLNSIDWAQLTNQPNARAIKTLMQVDRGSNTTVSLVHLELNPATDLFAVMKSLDNVASVMWSAPNFHLTTDPREFVPNDPRYSEQYHHPRMQNNLAWDITLGSSSIIVGVTDDGVQTNHSDLNSNIWRNLGEGIEPDGLDNDGNGYIDDLNGWDFSSGNNDPNPNSSGDTHGTHVSGIAAGRTNNGIGVAGTAGGSTIMPLQFYGVGAWTAAKINETFTYAANNGAHIVNTSYNIDGWVGDPVFTAGLQYLHDSGVLHFNSAGNNSQLNPARQAFDQTLLVVSTDANDLKSSFSNYGTGADLSAPGSDILSSVTGNSYDFFSGTSMATPNAAGAAALIWSANPTWTRDQVAAQLLATTDNIDALNPSFAGLMGTGRANPFKALTTTIAAPQVRAVNGLPANGAFLDDTTIDSFSISFSQLMDPASVNGNANFELRSAGLDGAFDTSDDVVLSLTKNTYRVGTNQLNFSIDNGPMNYGKYRLRLTSGGLQNPFGTDLDGDGNGNGGDDYVHVFTISPPTTGTVNFHRASYLVNDTVQIVVGDANGIAPISVTVTTSGGDSETLILAPQGAGKYSGAINTVPGSVSSNDGAVQVALGQTITVTYVDPDDGSGNQHIADDTAVISNVVQYDSNDVPKTISDNTTITSVINISDVGRVADLDLALDITHTYTADLSVFLIAPNGTRIELFQGVGGSGDNFTATYLDDEAAQSISQGAAPFTGSFRPVGSFAELDELGITGTWTLEISDNAGGDVGTLNAWSLFIDVRSFDQGAIGIDKPAYNLGETVLISIIDGNAAGPITVIATSDSGDTETILLNPVAPGQFAGSVITAGGSIFTNDGFLQAAVADTLTFSYIDADDGSGNSNTVTATANISNIVTFDSNDVPKTINDNSTITSTIEIAAAGLIRDLDLRLDITHTYVGDLDAFLIAPDGTRIALFDRVGGSGDNFSNTRFDDEAAVSINNGTAPFSGSFRPDQTFAALDNLSITGTWTLEITDNANADVGSLNSWSLIIDVIPVAVPKLAVIAPQDPIIEGPSGTQTAIFTVQLSQASGQTVTVDYATTNSGYLHTAHAGRDFTPVAGQLTFLPGQTSKTVEVTVFGDKLVENDEQFGLSLTNSSNAGIDTELATVTLADEDLGGPRVDFGHELSPIEAKAVGVGDLLYTEAKKIGWQPGHTGLEFIDRGVGSVMNRDIALVQSAQFSMGMANRWYTVSMFFGDSLLAHDNIQVTVEGIAIPVFSTAAGSTVTKSVVVQLTDGVLDFEFNDLGGSSSQLAIAGLSVGSRTLTGTFGFGMQPSRPATGPAAPASTLSRVLTNSTTTVAKTTGLSGVPALANSSTSQTELSIVDSSMANLASPKRSAKTELSTQSPVELAELDQWFANWN